MSKIKLSEIGTFKNGLNYAADKADAGCKMIAIPNFCDNYIAKFNDLKEINDDIVSEDYLLENNDILFVRSNGNKNLVGRSMIVLNITERMTFSSFCIRFRITDEKVNPLYMLYLFKSPLFRKLLSNNPQTSISNLNQEILGNIQFELPALEEQDKVLKAIHSITKRIENNAKVNDNLQQQLKLIYDYWFAQFDFPDKNGRPYKSSGGKMVFSSRLKHDIPEEWKVESIISNSMSTPIMPGVHPFVNKTYLATADVSGSAISTGSTISYETRESRANMQPTVSSVWFAKMKNSIKHLYLNKEMSPIIEGTILSTGFCGLQCTEKSFEYIATFIEHSYFESVKDVLAHGATQESVNNDDLLGITMLTPPDDVLQTFHDLAGPIYAQISRNICENRQLTALRDWLLPMLMNGQATISD